MVIEEISVTGDYEYEKFYQSFINQSIRDFQKEQSRQTLSIWKLKTVIYNITKIVVMILKKVTTNIKIIPTKVNKVYDEKIFQMMEMTYNVSTKKVPKL